MQTNRLPIKPKTNAWHLIYDARSKQICGAIQGCGECGGGRRQQNEIETTASKGNSNGSCYLCQPITINSVCIEMIKLRSQLMVSLFCYTENRLTDRLIQANRQKTIDKSATKSCVCWDYANDTKWILAMHNISVTITFNCMLSSAIEFYSEFRLNWEYTQKSWKRAHFQTHLDLGNSILITAYCIWVHSWYAITSHF